MASSLVAKVCRHERRLSEAWERDMVASFDRGRQMVELRIVPVGSVGVVWMQGWCKEGSKVLYL